MDQSVTPEQQDVNDARWELLEHIDVFLDKPMIALSLVWLGLLIRDLTYGLSPLLQTVSDVIWALFVLDFVLGFTIAPHKRGYLRRNWLTVISLLLPALRVFRIVRVIRILRVARASRSLNLVRVLTSTNRGMRAIGMTLGRHGAGYVIALTIIVTFVGAAGMAFLESPAALRQAGVGQSATGLTSYGDAFWWTAMIMTTLGSEYWPKTVEGRILGWLLSVYALATFGYITATIASYFVGQTSASAQSQASSSSPVEADLAALQREIADLRVAIAALNGELTSQRQHDAGHNASTQ